MRHGLKLITFYVQKHIHVAGLDTLLAKKVGTPRDGVSFL